MNTPDSTRSILDSLRRIVRELHMFSRQAETTSGLTAAQLFVLEKVADSQPVSVNQLAALTLTHQSSVSVVAQRLVERGFLSEHRSAHDARRKELSITAAGRAALKQAPKSVQDRLISAARAMASNDRDTLDRLLRQLIESAGLSGAAPELFFEKTSPSPVRAKQTSIRNPKRKAAE